MTAFDHYWQFAAERQNIFWHKYHDKPYTSHISVLRTHKFTNCYRALDRVSQFLIGTVQAESRSRIDALFRTLLFKVFNRIETWQQLEYRCGELNELKLDKIGDALDRMKEEGLQIYSGAYMMNTPPAGCVKHHMHLQCLKDFLWKRPERWGCIEDIYSDLHSIKNFGTFLAYQFAIDMNYVMGWEESTFVVPGPGCISGVKKCHGEDADPVRCIYETCEMQVDAFKARRLQFKWLPGRALQWIDIQNLYCETDKYLREMMPQLNRNRSRIKTRYSPSSEKIKYMLPSSWKIDMRLF